MYLNVEKMKYVKTRWNTMEVMLYRFLRIKQQVKNVLSDLNFSDPWNEKYLIIQPIEIIHR